MRRRTGRAFLSKDPRRASASARRCKIVDHPFREPPPYYDVLPGEPPLPRKIVNTDSEAEASDEELEEEDTLASPGSRAMTRATDASPEPEPVKIPDGGRDDADDFVRRQRVDADKNRVRLAPPPRELLLPEHLILPYAKHNFTAARGARVVHNLLFAVEEADRNYARRERLAAKQYELIDHAAEAKKTRNRVESRVDRRTVLEGLSHVTALAGGGLDDGGFKI